MSRRGCIAALALALALAPAGPALAQAPGFGAVGGDGPIEIAADELEVRQDEGRAIFRGDVDAVQGELRLTADALEVFYGQGGTAEGEIERIVATGAVVVRSRGDVARGDEGVYDLATRTITLTGDVVLTRDENVLRGSRLEVDVASGVATMRAGEGGGRVRALFRPSADGSPTADGGASGGGG